MSALPIVASTGGPAFAVDPAGRVIEWNEAARSCFGYRRKGALGCRCWELLRGEDFFSNPYCGEDCPLRKLALQGGPINSTQMYFRTAAGERKLVNLCFLVVPGETSSDNALVHMIQTVPPLQEPGQPGPARSGSQGNSTPLTHREIEVLELLGCGKGTQQIAENLFISSATVRHHIQNIFRKLKVHSRLQAVTLAQRIGLI